MKILKQHFGVYNTNCYIVKIDIGDFIIDPGVGSIDWVLKNVSNPLAILNTHGHFDHIWCNADIKMKLNIPILCPKEDGFMLESDCFNLGLTPFPPDIYIENNQKIYFDKNGISNSNDNIFVEFMFFPGHTPGCSMIKINDAIFSGDFIFKRSIGRVDFPYSSKKDMVESLKRFKQINYNLPLYPGHGDNTTIQDEQKNIDLWIKTIC